MKELLYTGWICESQNEPDAIYLVGGNFPSDEWLIEDLVDEMAGHECSVNYWVCDEQCSPNEAQEAFLKKVMGATDGRFSINWSEITGYLWTDEELNVGGHDLAQEIRSNIRKWLILEVTVHDKTSA